MQKRRLGRTGLQVSVVGFGGTWISQLSVDAAVQVVRRAFELGINYFDTAKLDGDSEEKIGAALKDVRDECVLATKTASRTKSESLADFKSSLNRLKTDRLDLIQLHGIDDEKTLQKAMGTGGSLEMCKKARSEGLVDFI
ncbi:MAG: aldo/keto reductase, partial [Candidatus Bathyarchaeum sp.]